MSHKVGRNDPCPCGSGKKYKKCHIVDTSMDPMSPEFHAEAWVLFDGKMAAEKKRKQRFGNVRPIIHANAWGKKLVGVGSRIYFNDDALISFSDFLQVHLRDTLGAEWWKAEGLKPVIARHPIAQWQTHAEELMRGEKRDERGRYAIPYDGMLAAFMSLAYDLYIVKDNVKFQEVIVERLKRRDHFSGVRYELLVAATFARAGFSIEPEDEASSKAHPEFVATHKTTNFVVAVEAKARNRRQNDLHPSKVQVDDLVAKAAGQGHKGKPFALFVDVAMPPEVPAPFPSWKDEVDQTVKNVIEKHGGLPGPFDCVIFTSFTYPGGLPDRPGLTVPILTWQPLVMQIPAEILNAILDALDQFGRIPEFETGS